MGVSLMMLHACFYFRLAPNSVRWNSERGFIVILKSMYMAIEVSNDRLKTNFGLFLFRFGFGYWVFVVIIEFVPVVGCEPLSMSHMSYLVKCHKAENVF